MPGYFFCAAWSRSNLGVAFCSNKAEAYSNEAETRVVPKLQRVSDKVEASLIEADTVCRANP